jgi:RNA 2',3'-cyclic 3'-phosphodiesterase
MFYSVNERAYMPEQLSLPGFERNPALDYLFFALLPGAKDAPSIVQLRERLRQEHGLKGQLIATKLLHISLHGVGEYDGVSRAVVEAAKQAAARVSTRPLDIVFDRAMSFKRKREGLPFVLRAGNDVALMHFYRRLGEAMKSVGFRRVASRFTPHMTLLYGDRMVKERPIEAVQWMAHDFVLVQSLRSRGRSEYIHLARWPLRE